MNSLYVFYGSYRPRCSTRQNGWRQVVSGLVHRERQVTSQAIYVRKTCVPYQENDIFFLNTNDVITIMSLL